jgi:hypothetical protein
MEMQERLWIKKREPGSGSGAFGARSRTNEVSACIGSIEINKTNCTI